MATTMMNTLCVLLVFAINGAHGGEWCTEYSSSIFDSTDTTYCSTSCCGDMYNRYCCFEGNVGTIVGIVIGCLIGVGAIITVIVVVCCCLKRRPGSSGHVYGAAGGTTITTVNQPMGVYPVGATTTTTTAAYPYGQGQVPVTTNYQYGQPQPLQQPYAQDPKFAAPPPTYEQTVAP